MTASADGKRSGFFSPFIFRHVDRSGDICYPIWPGFMPEQMSPLRFASVDMTPFRHSSFLLNLFSDFLAMMTMRGFFVNPLRLS
jgi:hypothetical protein